MTTTVRPAAAVEAEAIAELINAHASALHGAPDLTARTIRDWFANEDVEIRLVEIDGRLACYGDLVLSPSKVRADLDVREHPSHRGSSTWQRTRRASVPSPRPQSECRTIGASQPSRRGRFVRNFDSGPLRPMAGPR